MVDLRAIAKNLIEGKEGILTTPGHRDVEFMRADKTDWRALEEVSFWYRHRNRIFLAVTQRYKPEGPLFEIGSGNGSVSIALQTAGLEVVAVEPTVKWAFASHERGVNRVVCARVEEAGFAEGSLANIGLFDVLEHIDDDIGFVRQLRELMPIGGYFYCAVPAWKQLWSSEDDIAGHYRRYSLSGLSNIFNTTGFKVEYCSYFFAPLVLPIFLLRTIPSALHMRTFRTPELSDKEHRLPKGIIGRYLEEALQREARHISGGGVRRIGASCLLVARAR